MIRRPPRSTQSRSSAASDVYKRQISFWTRRSETERRVGVGSDLVALMVAEQSPWDATVSYTHLRAHETVLDLVCRLLLEKKNTTQRAEPLGQIYCNRFVRSSNAPLEANMIP